MCGWRCIAASYRDDLDRVVVGIVRTWLAEPGDEVTDQAVSDHLAVLIEQLRPKQVGYNSYTAGSLLHVMKRTRLDLVDMINRTYFTACGVLLDKVKTGGLVHDADPMVTEQVAYAAREDARMGGGFWFLSRKLSPGPIFALEAVAMATALAAKPAKERPRPVAVA
jgi:hypothetical protein